MCCHGGSPPGAHQSGSGKLVIDTLFVCVARFLTGANARWSGCAPELKQRIYFANHTSNLDALVLWASLPASVRKITRPVAARDYWSAGRLRLFLAEKVFNALLIERKNVTVRNNPLEPMLAALDSGDSLIIFPEGGRFPGPDPGPFKSGIYHLAKHHRSAELVPVYIDNLNRVMPKGEILPVPLLVSISFGCPLILEEGETKPDFLERARAAIIALRQS
jgi:1-acyl-sn-glycerol-3-phosphate acyltransferase